MEWEVLKAIIQKEPLNLEPLKGDLSAGGSIFADEDGNSLQGLRQEIGFIPRFLGREKDVLSVTHDRVGDVFAFISPAQDRD